MRKKIIIGICIILLAVVGSVKIYNKYFAFNPTIVFTHGDGGDRENYYIEKILLAIGEEETAPKKYSDAIKSFADWNIEIARELYMDYIEPTEVKVYGEIVDGKVVFKFIGYVTTQDGETIDYYKEGTFDFGVIPTMQGF